VNKQSQNQRSDSLESLDGPKEGPKPSAAPEPTIIPRERDAAGSSLPDFEQQDPSRRRGPSQGGQPGI
jgi:hypothetical protein